MILGKWFEAGNRNGKWKSLLTFQPALNIVLNNLCHLVHSLLKIVYSDAIESENPTFTLTFVRMVQDQSSEQRNAATISINLSYLNAKHFDFPKNKHHFLTSSAMFAFLFSNCHFIFMTQYTTIKALHLQTSTRLCERLCAHNKTVINIEF